MHPASTRVTLLAPGVVYRAALDPFPESLEAALIIPRSRDAKKSRERSSRVEAIARASRSAVPGSRPSARPNAPSAAAK